MKPFYNPGDLSIERLRALVNYDPETGYFTWKIHGHGLRQGLPLGTLDKRSNRKTRAYRWIRLEGNPYLAQRLAYFYVHGEWPPRYIRFADGNPDNCAIANLKFGEHDFTTKEGRNAHERAHRAANPMTYRARDLRKDFGLTAAQYQTMFVAQGGLCACCRRPETALNNKRTRVKWLAVDHNHETGAIRGLLCQSCNHVVGHSKENPETLESAAAYLRYHGKPKCDATIIQFKQVRHKQTYEEFMASRQAEESGSVA